MKEVKCKSCGSPDIVKQADFYVCQHCGTKYEFTYEDILHSRDPYKDEVAYGNELEHSSDALEALDESEILKCNPNLFERANKKCFFSKLFSSPSLQYNEFLLAIILIVSAWVFFKFDITVLVGALCCFFAIGLLLHFLFRIIFNFGYYNNCNIRLKDNDIVIRYAVKVWEADNKEEIREAEAEFEQEKARLKEEYWATK